MSTNGKTHVLTATVDALSAQESLKGLFHQHRDGTPIPSGTALEEIVQLSRSILFPGYYGDPSVNMQTIRYHIGVRVERLYGLLVEQITAGLCFNRGDEDDAADEETCGDGNASSSEAAATARESDCCHDCSSERRRAESVAMRLIERLPEIRRTLATDVVAAFNGDPAADSYGEIISCYPVIKALTAYRLAHELYTLGVPLIPRMMTEMAHSETGIDIHPAATIGRYFTIDHGTGVVIGATCIIGDRVKLYQGVTLGAKSFPLDAEGNPIKGIPRHPILEDDVVVYANATVLGRITIGKGCVVGANVWVTKDMKPKTKKYKKEKTSLLDIEFNNGTGI